MRMSDILKNDPKQPRPVGVLTEAFGMQVTFHCSETNIRGGGHSMSRIVLNLQY